MVIIKRILPRLICFFLCIIVAIAVPYMASVNNGTYAEAEGMQYLTLWQVDSFEGGRGSRADYLQNLANKFSERFYITVTSISAEAARVNLKNGIIPDLISYGAGIFGIESYVKEYVSWCHGSYCILTLEENSEFNDMSTSNTVINAGIDNRADIAAIFCGVGGATEDRPTGAYVKLIGGKYRYLLGTQRDIFRLKSRGVQFSVKPVTQFNDLYQNISVTATDAQHAFKAREFVSYLLTHSENISKLGLFYDGYRFYNDELSVLEELTYEYRTVSPVNESYISKLNGAVLAKDINLLKNLLK